MTKTAEQYNLDLATGKIRELATSQANKSLIMAWDKANFASGLKQSSRATKLMGIISLLRWKPELELKELTAENLIDFKEHLSKSTYCFKGTEPKPYSEQTITCKLAIIKTLCLWLNNPEAIAWFKPKRSMNGKLKAQEILTKEDVLAMVSASNSKRNKALVSALWETGARVSEFLQLKIKDLNNEGNLISMTLNGKTGERQAFIVASVPSMIEWLEMHPDKTNPNAFVWAKGTHKNGQPLTKNTLLLSLRKTAVRAGITKPVFPHAFRHSRATHCALAGQNENVLRQLFGWSPGSSTPSIYVTLAAKDAKNAALELAGLKSGEKETPLEPKKCIRCGEMAALDALTCRKCFWPLTAEAAMKQKQTETERIAKMIEVALVEKGVIKN
jgi:site-specific recombinase XerD